MDRQIGVVTMALWGLLVALSGCEGSAPVEALPGAQLPVSYALDPLPEVEGDPLLFPRLIGHQAGGGACPPLGPEWTASPLFASAPPGLAGYCRYDWSDTSPPTQLDIDLALTNPPLALYPDRPVVGPTGPLVDVWKTSAVAATRAHAGDIQSMSGTPPRKVRVAVLDNHPTIAASFSPWSSPTGEHGQDIAAVIRDLACDNLGRCAVDVSTRQAMGLRRPMSGEGEQLLETVTYPGDFGSIADLAVAIRAEVAAWKEEGAHAQLVLNLSLAWHPVYGGLDDPGGHPDTAAVYDALVDAQCRGVLVIAATGNVSGGSEQWDGPLLPAAWGTKTVSASDCAAMMGQPWPADDEPLLYAASAVDTAKRDISTSRPDSRSSWAAYGYGVTLSTSTGSTAPRTGTSMSAAVLSAAAGAVLAWRPTLTPHEVMTTIHSSGQLVGDADPLWVDAGLPATSRRVSVCPALSHACSGPVVGGSCGNTHKPTCLWTTPGLTANVTQLVPWQAAAPNVSYTPIPLADGGVCPPSLYTDITMPDPVLACPEVQRYDSGVVAAYVDPQPEDGHCPTCALSLSNSTLYLESPYLFSQHTDRMIRVVWQDDTFTVYNVPPLGAVYAVEHNLPASSLANVKSAAWMSTVSGVTRISPIVILP